MTDGNRFAYYNIKYFDDLSRRVLNDQKIDSYQNSLKEEENECFESMAFCPDRICVECGDDHSFRSNFDGAVTSIDTLPALFEDGYRSNCRIMNKLQEFVN